MGKKAKKLDQLRKENDELLGELEASCRAYAMALGLLRDRKPGSKAHTQQFEVLRGALSELRGKAKEANRALKKEAQLAEKVAGNGK